MPENSLAKLVLFVKMLSIREAVEFVIRVGFVIIGKKEWAKFKSINSLVEGWVECLMISIL
jgi:hypothetical protein